MNKLTTLYLKSDNIVSPIIKMRLLKIVNITYMFNNNYNSARTKLNHELSNYLGKRYIVKVIPYIFIYKESAFKSPKDINELYSIY